MNALDWLVLLGTVAAIVGYGLWKSRGTSTADDWLRGKERPSWSTMGLAVMATQASAITFLSVPGQAYDDGMRFVQVYFGLPFAMIFISAFMVPRYYKLNVYTAYEYLEKRFDVRVRVLGALLFLLQRGLSAGVTIYAPAILLSAMLGWPLQPTIVGIGSVVIAYTVLGGATTVSQTQKQQMIVMLAGVVVAGVLAVHSLPQEIGVADALAVAGALGRTEAVTTTFDLKDRYNIWSGVLGGFFLSLAYFGTDQSQVGRYLHGKSVTESRLGLLLNGVLKIPMQFAILLTGVLVFALYQFTPPPLTFNAPLGAQMQASAGAPQWQELQDRWGQVQASKELAARRFVQTRSEAGTPEHQAARADLQKEQAAADLVRKEAAALVRKTLPKAEPKDSDYVFLTFVSKHLPHGIIGLLVAVILFAAMSSTASELNALGTTTALDLWKRLRREEPTEAQILRTGKLATFGWGLTALGFASFASLVDNLIQAVNIMGSLFYGAVLGLFLSAFFLPRVGSTAALIGAVVAQVTVLVLYVSSDLGFLWYNLVGCLVVMVVASAVQLGLAPRPAA
jgi:Na+/proline symporter